MNDVIEESIIANQLRARLLVIELFFDDWVSLMVMVVVGWKKNGVVYSLHDYGT